ncbi:MAG: Gfo/Idh/MocA family oxidoreductase [candidate division Zixibacteria bacterium]|nr:Gfo/Idh/MocA family oxidoreductase [candidate division Zixibacteria bacterium]
MTVSPVRVAVLGAGSFANKTHLPNLKRIDGVEVVALCDVDAEKAKETAERFGIPGIYHDAKTMYDAETIDALYSIVPAYVRTDLEITAVELGIHLFSEKPQAIRMEIACRIADAVRKTGVVSTVGFRERYRPLFQQARHLLADRRVTHARFHLVSPYPEHVPGSWWSEMEKGGVPFFDWGVHATDYIRFVTQQNVVRSQAFFYQPEGFHHPFSASFHYQLSQGATATLTFIEGDPVGLKREPYFLFFFDGGHLGVYGYERIEINDVVVYEAAPFDPWFEQDRVFIEAVRARDPGLLMSDYPDGLLSLAPILAGWESSRRDGACWEVETFLEAAQKTACHA